MIPSANAPRTIVIDANQSAWTNDGERNMALCAYFGASPIRCHTIDTAEIRNHQDDLLEITVTYFDDPTKIKFAHDYKRDTLRLLSRNRFESIALPRPSVDSLLRPIFRIDIEDIIETEGSSARFVFRFRVRSLFWNQYSGFYIAPGQGPGGDLFLTLFPFDYLTDDNLPIINPYTSSGPHPQGLTASCGVKIPGGRP
ncbi:hypothetical protein ACAW74_08480 [Fibrella sp. WM1]|uniref:hypothetical protein n=1 Tax=Fibrella musci TaxID=3242485 RepID=UPI00351FC75D